MKRLAVFALVSLLAWPAFGQTPKPGGTLNLRLREDLPQGFAIHESPTISTQWPAMPCFSNLVLFDPAKPTHSVYTIDLVREARDAGKLRLNPRRDWFVNVAAVEAVDAQTVVFRLKRPQPSLL